MDLEKLAKECGEKLGRFLFDRKEEIMEKINIEKLTPKDIFKICFNKLFHEGNYNKAEDLLFDELKKNNSPDVYEIALQFYNSLEKKSDEELYAHNFSRDEIYQGLNDIKKFKPTS
ncbi:DUF6483 family protein [Clostridium massiliodielmoense]|uniref:DUF6483 family protein n=1 Tax=Clostridium massiliodielmoense TaxID=1776385 RepID=UPI0004D51A4E|nr:DUF6483 family protein [Clostridium massiliodielmoense]KEH91968.1 hypothetical protein Z962_12830 [Clostridium botulinum C/D str. BKT12695]